MIFLVPEPNKNTQRVIIISLLGPAKRRRVLTPTHRSCNVINGAEINMVRSMDVMVNRMDESPFVAEQRGVGLEVNLNIC